MEALVSIESGTYAALLTAPAPGAIAVVGLDGPCTEQILQSILQRPGQAASSALACSHGCPTLCRVMDGQETVDEAIVVLIRSGLEAYAEINLHGGVRIAQRVVMLLERLGAKIVEPRGLLGMSRERDPIIRDVNQALLRSQSRRMTHWLLRQREILPPFLRQLERLSATEGIEYQRRTELAVRLICGLNVAIIGPPNAGKSTLANRLIGHDRVITSAAPGTTRDWVSETALVRGWPITLTDTAGIRASSCEIETEAIRRGAEQARRADLVLMVLDSTLSAAEQHAAYQAIVNRIPAGLPRVIVFNKSDCPAAQPIEIGTVTTCRISALQGIGIEALENRIEQSLGLQDLKDDVPTGISPNHLPSS